PSGASVPATIISVSPAANAPRVTRTKAPSARAPAVARNARVISATPRPDPSVAGHRRIDPIRKGRDARVDVGKIHVAAATAHDADLNEGSRLRRGHQRAARIAIAGVLARARLHCADAALDDLGAGALEHGLAAFVVHDLDIDLMQLERIVQLVAEIGSGSELRKHGEHVLVVGIPYRAPTGDGD